MPATDRTHMPLATVVDLHAALLVTIVSWEGHPYDATWSTSQRGDSFPSRRQCESARSFRVPRPIAAPLAGTRAVTSRHSPPSQARRHPRCRRRQASPINAGVLRFRAIITVPEPLVHTVFDTSWRTLDQSSPSTVTADNQCAVITGIFVHKTVESILQVTELANSSGFYEWIRGQKSSSAHKGRADHSYLVSPVTNSVYSWQYTHLPLAFSLSNHPLPPHIHSHARAHLDDMKDLSPPSSPLPPASGWDVALCSLRRPLVQWEQVVRLLASDVGEPCSIPGGIAFEFSHVRMVPDDADGWRVSWMISCFPSPLHSGSASMRAKCDGRVKLALQESQRVDGEIRASLNIEVLRANQDDVR
ncbi:hypothetical protein PR048_003193 [Dryococelus australis]|uniref:Uncharacterized protein n=1 Tax=Dryococelus australis TaxID=614101 RepID=A0ABQ9IMB5_9NEOP|nr:hypothetical protein PR048_003193 [Dryococelus australis]